MTENDFPIVPLILGLVMGQIAEENFVVAFRLSRGSFSIFFENIITWILWAVIIGALAVPPLLAHLREKKRKAGA
jgi:putative tricarboxylic transport membrane protein